MSNHIEEFPLAEIHENCAALRLTNSRAQAAMVRSLATHGQLTPVVCIRRPEGLELVDGLKRLRSARLLLWPAIQVRLLERSGCAAKAEMIKLNRVTRSIHTIEEGRILHSLHRDDRLTPAQIAALMGCSQKWVDRRLQLVEGLHVEVLGHLDRGLISADMVRELAKIPHCLQEQALGLTLEERLGSRELGKLARFLCAYQAVDSTVVLANLWEVIPPEVPCPAPSRKAWFHRLAELNVSPEDEGELIRLYTLAPQDLAIIRQRRGDANRLGFATQLCSIRYPGLVISQDDSPDPNWCGICRPWGGNTSV